MLHVEWITVVTQESSGLLVTSVSSSTVLHVRGPTDACDLCEQWYCASCEGLTEEPTNETYICSSCCAK